jgi:cardiolipin synthase A/B
VWTVINRKLMVIDSEIGYTGGAGLAAWMRPWRDTTVRVQGPVACAMERALDQLWRGAEGRPGEPDLLPPERPDAPFRVVTNTPHPHRNHLYKELRDGLRGATTYAYLATPYFMPNPAFFRAMLRAARRGVDVRLLLPGENDVALMAKVGESYYGRALKAGVRIFLYQGEILHTKAAVIDDRWATVGSANLDYLSFFGNHEANLVATEPAFVADMKRDFLADLETSREGGREEWRRGGHPTATLIGRGLRLARKFA